MSTTRSKCIVCGKEYDVCLSCKNVKSYRPWRTVCDSIDHYKIHLVLSDHTNGFITSEEAKEQLSSIKFDADELLPALKEHIDEINRATAPKPKRGKKSVKNCE